MSLLKASGLVVKKHGYIYIYMVCSGEYLEISNGFVTRRVQTIVGRVQTISALFSARGTKINRIEKSLMEKLNFCDF